MGVTSASPLPFSPETYVFSTVFKLLQANSTLFKHLWLVTLETAREWLEKAASQDHAQAKAALKALPDAGTGKDTPS